MRSMRCRWIGAGCAWATASGCLNPRKDRSLNSCILTICTHLYISPFIPKTVGNLDVGECALESQLLNHQRCIRSCKLLLLFADRPLTCLNSRLCRNVILRNGVSSARTWNLLVTSYRSCKVFVQVYFKCIFIFQAKLSVSD